MILSPDDFLIHPDGAYDWSPSRVAAAWRDTLDRVKSLLPGWRFDTLVLLSGVPAAGKSTWLKEHQVSSTLYVDATFTSRISRAPFLSLAASFGKPVDVVWVDTPIEECIRRNSLRPLDRQVPAERMAQFHHALYLDPPTVAEGFRAVHVIRS